MSSVCILIKESGMTRPIFIMIVLVVMAFAGPMFIKKPDGTSFIESPLDYFTSSPKESTTSPIGVTSMQSFYKWQDENGTWHYSDQPQAGQNIETVTVDTNVNLIQGLKIEKKKEDHVRQVPKQAAELPSIPLPMTVPLEKVSKMLDDANNIQQLMDDRTDQIDQATRGR